MKTKIILSITFLLGCIAAFGQVDTTGVAEVSQAFNIDSSWIIGAVSVLYFVVGHFAIPKKWTSASLWLEKVVYKIYIGIKWFNDKTNKSK